MKGKRLLILGAAFALGLSACAGATRIIRINPLKASGDEKTTFTAASGDYDANVEFASYKGGGTSNPAVNSNQIRLYQTSSSNAGGMLVVKAKGTAKLNSITVGSAMSTTIGYSIGNEYTAATPKTSFTSLGSVSADETKTLSDLDTTVVTFACLGTSSSSRWYVNYLSVSYTGGSSSQLTYLVTYDANGATSGSVPTDATEYIPGETVTVLGNTGNLAKTNYTFGGWSHPTKDVYQAGGTFIINANVTLTAIWNEIMDENADLLDRELTGVEGNNYVDWSGKNGASGAVYAGNSAGNYDSIQLRNSNEHKDSGIITTTSGGNAKKVGVIWENHTENGRVINVYGKNTPYSAVTDLFDSSTAGTLIGTIVRGTSSSLIINDAYRYVGICSANNTSYLMSVHITWEEAALDPQVTLSTDAISLKTNQSVGATVSATIQDIENPTFTWTANNSNVLLENTDTETVTIKPNINVDGSAIITLTVGGVTPNIIKTVSVTISVPGPGETVDTAYTVEEAIDAIDAATGNAISNAYVKGIITRVTYYNSTHHSLTYFISDDGTETTEFEVYGGLGVDGANFSSKDDLKVGSTVIVFGNIKLYDSSVYEFEANNYQVLYQEPVVALASIEVINQNVLFELGDDFVFGGSVIAKYADNSTKDVTSDAQFSGYDKNRLGNQTITVSYEEGKVTKTFTYSINVVNIAEKHEFSWDLTKKTYVVGATISDGDTVTWSSNYAVMTNTSASPAAGTSASNYLGGDSNNRTSSRFYSGNILTVSSIGGCDIASIVFTATSDGYATALKNSTWTNANASSSGTSVIVTPVNGLLNVSATIGGTCGFTSVKVVYKDELCSFLSAFDSIKTIRGNAVVDENEQVTAVNSLAVRFGVKISAETWDAISTFGYSISEYGIKMFLTNNANTESTVEGRGNNVASVSANATPYKDGQGNYNFIAVVNIPDDSANWPDHFSYSSYFCVRPYVVINNKTFYLLEEDMHESVKTLAVSNNGTNLSEAALSFLAA